MSKLVILLGLGIASTACADSMASISGMFSNATIGAASGTEWTFASGSNESSLSFVRSQSPVITNQSFNLGQILLTNGGQGGIGNGEHTIDLVIDIDFAQLAHQVRFVDPITLKIDNGSGGSKIAFTSIPAPQTFTSGGLSYVVTFNGMFDAPTGGNNITANGLNANNPRPHEGVSPALAYLQATLSSGTEAKTLTFVSNPEPWSVVLLLTSFCLALVARRRRALQ